MTASPHNFLALDQRIAKLAANGLARTPIKPNGVTAASIPLGFGAAWLLAQGGLHAHWGAGLFVVVVWLDHVDGELARATGTSSQFGHYFDHVAALLNYVMMFVGAGIGIETDWFENWGYVLGICAGVSVASIMAVRVFAEERIGRHFVRQKVRAGFEIEDTLYIVAPLTWFGILDFFILLAGIGAPVFLIYTVWSVSRSIKLDGGEGAA